MQISEKDAEILRCLQDGPDQTRQELAERVGLSASTLWRRVSELEAAGVIRKRVTLLDPDKVGLPVCVFVSVNLTDHSGSSRSSFETLVNGTPEIMECFSVTGAFDYVLLVRTRSVVDFEHLLMETILGHGAVANASSQIALRQQKYTTALPL